MADKHPLNYLIPRDGDYALEWEELDEPRTMRPPETLRPEDRIALGMSPHPADEDHTAHTGAIQGAEVALRSVLLRPRSPPSRRE